MNRPPLILGTAEFNPAGYAEQPAPSEVEVVRILNLAWEAGITTLATSLSYGCTDLVDKYAKVFKKLDNTREPSKCSTWGSFYHYRPGEANLGVKYGSVYDKAQLKGLKEAIVPLNIHNTEFGDTDVKFYARSILDRGRLLQVGYSLKDCIDFVLRHSPKGIIIGVKSVEELEDFLMGYY